ncbi:MAG: hypothetical protein FWE91_11215 [Defluviitaleaceae bacterium]|nr:hypothetical protein [Defluviitaleaceae bacterium]
MVIGIVDALSIIDNPASVGMSLRFCVTSILYGLLASAVPNEIRKILGWENIEI